jgi:NAD(P)-dependent dehydrogenase (short-subunit alcohol dehydrogenase family)
LPCALTALLLAQDPVAGGHEDVGRSHGARSAAEEERGPSQESERGPSPRIGVGQKSSAVEFTCDWEDHLAQLEFFVKSPVLLGRAVLPGMRARGFGRIVQIDSEVVDRPPPGRSAYPTAKSAQIGLTRSWARELAPVGITVNTVGPGFIPVERHADVPKEVRSAYLESVPAGRMGNTGGHCSCGQLPGVGRGRLRDRPAHRGRRRPEPVRQTVSKPAWTVYARAVANEGGALSCAGCGPAASDRVTLLS